MAQEIELDAYQLSLKKGLSILGNCFSLILILVGLFLLVSGLFGVVNQDKNNKLTDNIQTDNVISQIPVDNGTGKIDDNSKPNGEIGDGISIKKVNAASLSADAKAQATENYINKTHKWKATNYVKGDIGIGEYKVRLGDTLWEIAEAVYGSGAQWHKILEANKNQIGFLKDGSQALIKPGQILILNN